MTRDRDPAADEGPSAARQAADDPEPDWAQRIRDLRRQRGERLQAELGADGAGGDRPDDRG